MADAQRNVHWALDVSISDFGSPFDTTSSSSSCTSTSSFQYINSQLVAHGFVAGPGISLEGISSESMECITKCLLAMLSQRVRDMSQAEALSTKLRTLSYDHERLINMHHSSTDKALSAEREVNMYKSRLATAARSLQQSESSHKQTAAELQRTRTSMQALRTTHVAELKRKEKEIERMVEKWTKLADFQAKSSPGVKIRGANAEVASGMELLGKGKGYLEVALEHAEGARKELLDETTRLRRLVLVSANRLQSMIHEIRILASMKSQEPTFFDHDALFPIAPINATDDKILSLFASATDAISVLSNQISDSSNTTQVKPSGPAMETDSEECKRLRATMEKLQIELAEAKKLHDAHASETRELFNQLAAQGMQGTSMGDPIANSKRTAEHDQLDHTKKELEDEREKFTQATVKLAKEKTAFESERIQFMEEKRSWQAQKVLSEHAPIPPPEVALPGAPFSPGLAAHLPEAKKSPRKSPRKKVVGKSSNSRKTRASRRSSASIPPPTNVEPAYETEVIPIIMPASRQEDKSSGLTKSILPTSFVLPPPSPRTSLPPPESLLGHHIPESDPDLTKSPLPNLIPTIIEPTPILMQQAALAPASPLTSPAFRRPFPVAKPLAPHMTHAYSPIKPSPLSRILMLAQSPESPETETLPKSYGQDTTPTDPAPAAVGPPDTRNAEDSPLREKKTGRNAMHGQKADKVDAKKRLSRERSKVMEEPAPTATGKTRAVGVGEKENRDKPLRRASPPAISVPPVKPSSIPPTNKLDPLAKPTTKPPTKLPVGKGGARRVPIGSAEAAPLPSWRG